MLDGSTNPRCIILASLIFFLHMKTERAISGTSAATYKVTEPHSFETLTLCPISEFSLEPRTRLERLQSRGTA